MALSELERNNSTETKEKTKPRTYQQEFHSSELPSALQSLTRQPRWVCWRWEWREQEGKPGGGNWTKPPIQCGAGWPAYASTDDPSTWGTYDEAVTRVRDGQADGIGYCLLGADIGAADLDDCHDWETRAIAPWARAIIDRAPNGTYCEVTVSGTGLHLLGEATGKCLIRKYSPLMLHQGARTVSTTTARSSCIGMRRATSRFQGS
jgi:primase-polymerase (primpol)-like protein